MLNHFTDYAGGYLIVNAAHSEFYGGMVGGYALSCYFTNCLMDRMGGAQFGQRPVFLPNGLILMPFFGVFVHASRNPFIDNNFHIEKNEDGGWRLEDGDRETDWPQRGAKNRKSPGLLP